MGVALDVGTLRAGSMPWVIGIVAAVGLFASVTLHELGHSRVALRYGLEIESTADAFETLALLTQSGTSNAFVEEAGAITSRLRAPVDDPARLPVPAVRIGRSTRA